MTLDEIRVEIDAVDTQMKPLFMKRMECAKGVANAKALTGGNVFVMERELAIIEKRASGVEAPIYDEYVAFLRHLMSVSRRYQYGILTDMQDTVIENALDMAGLTPEADHQQVKIQFACEKAASDLNLFINMTKLNKIDIESMNLETHGGSQIIIMKLEGNVNENNMRRLLCQIGKEALDFKIVALK